MSLDLYLTPDPCPHCGMGDEGYCFYTTHNHTEMANAVGLYMPLWRPEKIGITMAEQLIPHLEAGIAELKAYPQHYKRMDSPNGFGTYDQFVPILEQLLAKCREMPSASVRASR